jgi:hypothetical protein
VWCVFALIWMKILYANNVFGILRKEASHSFTKIVKVYPGPDGHPDYSSYVAIKPLPRS